MKSELSLSPNSLKALTLRYSQAYVSEFSPRNFESKIKMMLDTDVPM